MSFFSRFFNPQSSVNQAVAGLANFNIPTALSEQFAAYLNQADERNLVRFNPAYLAEHLTVSRHECLNLLATALQAGIVNLNWEVQCPYCGFQDHAFASLRQAHSDFVCSMCKMTFHAHLDDEIHVTFSVSERVRNVAPSGYSKDWAMAIDERLKPTTSHELLTVQAFRDLFVNEPLPEGESFQVKWSALMFTDLGGSTAIYARKGDPRAYSLVREHFNLIFAAVNEANGAVVKTIGDAVMAVFLRGSDAVRAAQLSQQRVAQFNRDRGLGDDECLKLKIGLHAGATLAVTLNDRLDYFGTTVNAAARVQGQAHNGEIVITKQVRDDRGVRELLPTNLATEMLMLRGLDDMPFEVVRI